MTPTIAATDQLTDFLGALWPDLGGYHLLLWSTPLKRSEWVQEVTSETTAKIEQWAKSENIYVGCGLRRDNLGPTRRGERADVVVIPGLWIDADYLGTSGDHKKPNLPPTEADARRLLEDMGLPPSTIVHTGHGLQAWWLFREPWIFEDNADRDKAERLTKAWCDTFRAKAEARGWDADQVGDLPRVMRLPGTWNRKGTPVPTRLLSLTEDRYNPADFETYLSHTPPRERPASSQKWNLVKRADAEPPSAKFLLLCENEPTFKNLCLRIPRPGQTDKSSSGFDFQLARIAFAAGWSGQEVCNLIIAQRRAHGANLKLEHPKYYELTLDGARAGLYTGPSEEEVLPQQVGEHSLTDEELPEINAGITALPALTQLSWQALTKMNHQPHLFRFGGLPSRLESDQQGSLILRELNIDRLRYEVANASRWVIVRKDKKVDTVPPLGVIRNMLASPVIPLPALSRIVNIPVFSRDGHLLKDPGYHIASEVFYEPSKKLTLPAVSLNPSTKEVDAAKSLLLDEFLCDFPFARDSSRAHALSCLLLPFVRDLIEGPTPLHMIEKPTSRTGGTLLATMLALPAVGEHVTQLAAVRDDDEWRKLLTTVLQKSPLTVCFDNVRHRVESGALASAITATLWTDRLLGHTQDIQIPVRTAWIFTGNNPRLSDEILNRTVFIRLDAQCDRPQDRTGFRHVLPRWGHEHRGELIHAALTICQSWITAGRPEGRRQTGDFREWSAVMGGLLEHLEIPGFGCDLVATLADPETLAWERLFRAWWETYQGRPVGVSELWLFIEPYNQEPMDIDIGDGSPRSQKVRFGRQLIERRDRQFTLTPDTRVQLVAAGSRHGAQLWKLQQVVLKGVAGELLDVPVNVGESE